VISLGLALAATAWSLVLLVRSGEARVGFLTAMFGLLAADRAIALWTQWGAPLGFDAPTAGQLAVLVACLLSLLVVGALRATLSERDRGDALHWDSMEAVRGMSELVAETKLDLDEKLAALLDIGCTRFGLEVGMVSRVKGERYQVRAIHAPPGFPIARDAAFHLEETFCSRALASDRPLAIAHAANSDWASHPARATFRFEAYLGAAIPLGGEAHGTLGFGSLEPRKHGFTATDKDVLNLMARWLGLEFERAEARPAVRKETPPAVPSGAARRREPRGLRGIDANATLRGLEPKLRQLAGSEVELELSLAPELSRARAPSVPLERIVLSLVTNALEAMPDGGRLGLKTANLEFAGAEPGVFPAVTPNHYVTLSVSDTGGGLGADSLSRVFEPSRESASAEGKREGADRLSLSAVYRILQSCGGDLSVEAEPGRGNTFTLFLPRSREATARKQQPAPTAGADLAL
jgi:GAF domain-containing protein